MKINIYKHGKVIPIDLEDELIELVDRMDSELYDTEIPFELQKKITRIRNHIVNIKNGVKKLKNET